MSRAKKYILGIDPGLANTGWAVIESDGITSRYMASGTVKTNSKDNMSVRLKDIAEGVADILKNFTIDEVGIEETFVNKNNLSSLKLGHARGAIITILAIEGLLIEEYSATHIKKAIVGGGRASKEQIDNMVKILLPKAQPKNEHEADAIAIALTHVNNNNYNNSIRFAG